MWRSPPTTVTSSASCCLNSLWATGHRGSRAELRQESSSFSKRKLSEVPMKRVLLAAVLTFASLLHADEVPRRYIVATRAAAPVALRRILTDDLSPRAGREIQTWDLVD